MIVLGTILGCMCLSFLFSGMETGVLLLNSARIRHLKEHGSIGARILWGFMHHPDRLSSTVLIGHTIVNSVVMILVMEQFLKSHGIFIATNVAMFFTLILWYYGDLVSKALFIRFPNRLTSFLAPFLLATYMILWPVVLLFRIFSEKLIFILGGNPSFRPSRQMYVTREELKLLVREVKQETPMTGEQRNLVASIIDSQNATARDVMRPRSEVITVGKTQSDEEQKMIAAKSGFSRLPIQIETNKKTFWEGLWVAYDSIFSTQIKSRNPPRVPAEARLNEILVILRKAQVPFAFVVDQQGDDVGIVTVEDILRRYLGKIDL